MGLAYVGGALVGEAAHAATLKPVAATVVVLQPGGAVVTLQPEGAVVMLQPGAAVVTLQPAAGAEGVGDGEMDRLRKLTSAAATTGGTRGVPDGDMIELRRTAAGTVGTIGEETGDPTVR